MGIELNNQQVYAVYQAENWWNKTTKQVFEISGAGGCGKTFLAKYIIETLGLDIMTEVAFIAYTGKAAIQLARTGLPAQTVHSLIYEYEYEPERDETGKKIMLPNGKYKKKLVFKRKEKLKKRIKLLVVDEAPMLNEEIAQDILSYGLPVIALGDLNQLPPVFGKSYFLKNPDVTLTQIMRQAENDPIVWLAHRVLNGEPLDIGVYGKSSVIPRSNMNKYIMHNQDIILTGTNKLRHFINGYYREDILKLKRLDMPNVGEKIVCRRNDWSKCICDFVYMTNGLTGTVGYMDKESFDGKSILIDFQPDFTNKPFKNVQMDYKRLFADPTEVQQMQFGFNRMSQFEFAYAITTHMSQGSQYPKVLYLKEKMGLSKEDQRRLDYTAITRASEAITIAI